MEPLENHSLEHNPIFFSSQEAHEWLADYLGSQDFQVSQMDDSIAIQLNGGIVRIDIKEASLEFHGLWNKDMSGSDYRKAAETVNTWNSNFAQPSTFLQNAEDGKVCFHSFMVTDNYADSLDETAQEIQNALFLNDIYFAWLSEALYNSTIMMTREWDSYGQARAVSTLKHVESVFRNNHIYVSFNEENTAVVGVWCDERVPVIISSPPSIMGKILIEARRTYRKNQAHRDILVDLALALTQSIKRYKVSVFSNEDCYVMGIETIVGFRSQTPDEDIYAIVNASILRLLDISQLTKGAISRDNG
ncbi:hypothetical protein ACFQY8_03365 [Alloscardovia venturai]|uniref:Uncharacterized protein n=1 Tax=Alloscardovia venturai TaxID=1769421 RepID=A0ABW2Y3F9_9BIFI